jgi:uncharacterized membrane protein YhaH (DUF805 family)
LQLLKQQTTQYQLVVAEPVAELVQINKDQMAQEQVFQQFQQPVVVAVVPVEQLLMLVAQVVPAVVVAKMVHQVELELQMKDTQVVLLLALIMAVVVAEQVQLVNLLAQMVVMAVLVLLQLFQVHQFHTQAAVAVVH